jgi:hypothetical protein
MKKTILNAALLAAALLSAPMVAQASLVTWTLSGVTFDDGGTASGSFDFDASRSDETAYSNISITTTTVGAYTGSSSYYGADFNPNEAKMFDGFSHDMHYLHLRFDSALTGAGGTSVLTNSGGFASSESYYANEFSFDLSERYVTAGSVTAAAPVAAVPIPAAAWLMASGLGVFGAAARKRKTQAA